MSGEVEHYEARSKTAGQPEQADRQSARFFALGYPPFCQSGRLVEVQRHAANSTFRVHPDNGIFCARRAWDHGTETFRSHAIEGAYAAVADQLAAGHLNTLSPAMNDVVSEFSSLWQARHAARTDPIEDATVNGCMAEQLTKEQEEVAEKKGAFFF